MFIKSQLKKELKEAGRKIRKVEKTNVWVNRDPTISMFKTGDMKCVLARIHSEKKPRSQLMNFLVNEEVREFSGERRSA